MAGTVIPGTELLDCHRETFKTKRGVRLLERLKKYCSHSERGFLGSGEALAKEQAQAALRLSENEARTQKDRSLFRRAEWQQYF